MIIANLLNLFKQKNSDDSKKNDFSLAKNSRPINLIFFIILLLNFLFIMIPVIIKVPLARNLVNWYLQDTGNTQGDFATSIATILGTLLAVTGAIWAQSFFDSQKKKRLVKVILSQLYTELEDINDRAGECIKLMYDIAKKNNIPSEEVDSIEFKINDYNDLKLILQFNKSAWDRYKGDVIVLFNNNEFIERISYLYSVIGMVGNYPYISKKNIVTIGERSIELYGDVISYLEKLKK